MQTLCYLLDVNMINLDVRIFCYCLLTQTTLFDLLKNWCMICMNKVHFQRKFEKKKQIWRNKMTFNDVRVLLTRF